MADDTSEQATDCLLPFTSHKPSCEAIVFYDGDCGFCNRWVQFLLQRDTQRLLHFAPLQGKTAQRLLTDADIINMKSVVLWTPQDVYRESTAVVEMLRRLTGCWPWLGMLMRWIPRSIRDGIYRWVAVHRRHLGNSPAACRILNPEDRYRFLE